MSITLDICLLSLIKIIQILLIQSKSIRIQNLNSLQKIQIFLALIIRIYQEILIKFNIQNQNIESMPRASKSSAKDAQPLPTRKSLRASSTSAPKRQEPATKSKAEDLKSSKKIKKTQSDLSANDLSKSIKKPQAAKQSKTPSKDQQKKEVKIKMTGSIPVDAQVRNKDVRVLVQGGKNYAVTLNQSDVQHNNNKFYILQVLESTTNSNNFYFFTRWGRVGVVGQMAEMGPMPKALAISNFNSKLKSKSGGSGNYRIVQMNYQAQQEKKQQKKPQKQSVKGIGKQKQQVKSMLDPKVQDLIRLIFDMKMMNNQMKQIGYDAKKMPLGKLAKSSIMKGYESLKKLMQQAKNKKRKEIFAQQSSNFYSYIPHDFGFKNMGMFILDTQVKIRAKLQMLQSLQDIQIFTKLLNQGNISSDINELDSNYLKLNTEIKPLAQDTDQYAKVIKYVQNSHAKTHTAFKLKVQQVYVMSKDVQNARYRSDIHNKQLLWHGSRLTNYVGIISQGLRIAPPQAPVTGYMFGKGVYFADMVSKSANYCFTNRDNNTGLMILCEVALGNQNNKYYADYYANLLPDGKHSTKGCGKTAPTRGQKIYDDVYCPNEPAESIPISQGSLLYNQFIVYDVAQIKCKYLLKMKFIY